MKNFIARMCLAISLWGLAYFIKTPEPELVITVFTGVLIGFWAGLHD